MKKKSKLIQLHNDRKHVQNHKTVKIQTKLSQNQISLHLQ